jgi:hypothetical protein
MIPTYDNSYNLRCLDFNLKKARIEISISELLRLSNSSVSIRVQSLKVNLEKLIKDSNLLSIKLYQIDRQTMSDLLRLAFEDDTFKTKKLSYCVDFLLDKTYNYDNTIQKDVYRYLSDLISENTEFLNGLQTEIENDYAKLFLKKDSSIKVGLIVYGVSLVTMVALIPGLLGGLETKASIFTHQLKMIFGGLEIQESVVLLSALTGAIPLTTGIVSYFGMNQLQKTNLMAEFLKLNNDDLAVTLIKMMFNLKMLQEFKDVDQTAKKHFDSILDLYHHFKQLFFSEIISKRNGALKSKLKFLYEADMILLEKLKI